MQTSNHYHLFQDKYDNWQCAIKGHVYTIKIMNLLFSPPDNFSYLSSPFELPLEQHYSQIWDQWFT